MPIFRLLGFARLGCGCLVVRYHGPSVDRDVDYVEEKGCDCARADHARNMPISIRAHTAAASDGVAAAVAS